MHVFLEVEFRVQGTYSPRLDFEPVCFQAACFNSSTLCSDWRFPELQRDAEPLPHTPLWSGDGPASGGQLQLQQDAAGALSSYRMSLPEPHHCGSMTTTASDALHLSHDELRCCTLTAKHHWPLAHVSPMSRRTSK